MSQVATERTYTIRVSKDQHTDYESIRRQVEREHYEETGEARRFHHWEVMARIYQVPAVKDLIEKGRRKKLP